MTFSDLAVPLVGLQLDCEALGAGCATDGRRKKSFRGRESFSEFIDSSTRQQHSNLVSYLPLALTMLPNACWFGQCGRALSAMRPRTTQRASSVIFLVAQCVLVRAMWACTQCDATYSL